MLAHQANSFMSYIWYYLKINVVSVPTMHHAVLMFWFSQGNLLWHSIKVAVAGRRFILFQVCIMGGFWLECLAFFRKTVALVVKNYRQKNIKLMQLSPGTCRTPDHGIPTECGSGTDRLYLNCAVIQAFCILYDKHTIWGDQHECDKETQPIFMRKHFKTSHH